MKGSDLHEMDEEELLCLLTDPNKRIYDDLNEDGMHMIGYYVYYYIKHMRPDIYKKYRLLLE